MKMRIVKHGDTIIVEPDPNANENLVENDKKADEVIKNNADATDDVDDIWAKMVELAKKEYHPTEVTPFITAHHVVAAVESAKTGKVYTGFCIEGASGVINLCAERVAALNMYLNENNMVVRRMVAFRAEAPKNNGGMPCGACREFFMQSAYENREMEILTDFEKRQTIKLKSLIPNWWGDKRYGKK